MRLKGKTAIVTGSDSGIGRAIAVAFAGEGAAVAVTCHSDRAGADETLRTVEAAGSRGFATQVDVGDQASVADLFEQTRTQLGVPDILVNNAGIENHKGPLADLNLEGWERVIRVNLTGVYLCARAFIKARREAGGGRLLNVSSVHEQIPTPNDAAYGAAKGGVRTLMRTLSLELAPMGITVNNIAPGMIATPLTQARLDDPETRARELPNIPLKRPGQPEEVAGLAVYLASDDAAYVTGQTFTIDGGLTMNWGQGA